MPGCGMLRGAEDVKAIPASEAKFSIEAPCTALAAQSAVEGSRARAGAGRGGGLCRSHPCVGGSRI